ncbi:MAG TPA: nitrite/sulfite reductase [Geothermobacteraceae bacterium]|nr:nitrite/sulfite reductase [Geothermobacteraceae bacterium]
MDDRQGQPMNYDPQQLRLDGIYQQKGIDRYMQRVKIPAGALSTEQARKLAELADRHAGGRVHLTTRGSIEFHDLPAADLASLNRGMASVGLTGRGACGGAVRGISCSTTFSEHYETCQALARRLHRHFAGNPWFEGLPKKFKIGVDGDSSSGRHLIQDVGLIYAGDKDGTPLWDLWCAGGLGRAPQTGFLLGNRIPEQRLVPLIEAIIRVYRKHTPKGKRLKSLLNEIGEAEFRSRLRLQTAELPPAQVDNQLGQTLSKRSGATPVVTARIFAGELQSRELVELAVLAEQYADGTLLLTADQDIAFFPATAASAALLEQQLDSSRFSNRLPACRVCPGNHECAMGLAPTRELAHRLLEQFGTELQGHSLALSGCPNSCSQPQLAELGILPVKLVKDDDGSRSPRYDLYLRNSDDLGQSIASGLDEPQLFQAVADLLTHGFQPFNQGDTP